MDGCTRIGLKTCNENWKEWRGSPRRVNVPLFTWKLKVFLCSLVPKKDFIMFPVCDLSACSCIASGVQSMPCFLVLWNPLDLGDPQWTETYELRATKNWNELWVWSNSKIRDRIYRLGVFMVYLFLSDLDRYTGDHQNTRSLKLQVALGREEPQSLDLRGGEFNLQLIL